MMNRRSMLAALPLAGVAAVAVAASGTDGNPLPQGAKIPTAQLVYECDVTLADVVDFGATFEGHRRIIPITGGTFAGPAIRGQVLSGGADWNLTRTDGASGVEAAYYLRTDDGVTIRIVNRGIGGGNAPPDPAASEQFFMFTTPTFEAPTGKYDWLNRGVYVGTLGARREARQAVLIRVFRMV